MRLKVIEDVVMVAYPRGLADEAHGYPSSVTDTRPLIPALISMTFLAGT
jgi:hypothetical protein